MKRDHIIKYYSGFDEWGRLEREPIEFIINMHYIREHLPLLVVFWIMAQDQESMPWSLQSWGTKSLYRI